MTELDMIYETSKPEQAEFNALVESHVNITRLAAIIAKHIILAAEKYGVDTDEILDSVDDWVKVIDRKGIKIPPDKNFMEE